MEPCPAVIEAPDRPSEAAASSRLEGVVRSEFAYVWRVCRRLGLPEGDADDAAQQVFLVAARRLPEVRPGSERSFLYGTAVNVVAKWRQAHARRREDLDASLELIEAGLPSAEDLLNRQSERRLLDAMLDAMEHDLRVVFVLHEIEQLVLSQIAEALGIPRGTAASRLRRAREDFSARLARFQAKNRFDGGLR